MKKAPIHQLIDIFYDCFHLLNKNVVEAEAEQLALLVHTCMSGRRRKFHTLEHVFTVCEPLRHPLQTLAGLFHDVIYFQVDKGFPLPTQKILSPVVKVVNQEVFIKTTLPAKDRCLHILLALFKFRAGQKLSPFAGLNEFLSAYTAMKSLERLVPIEDLLTIAVCIEATIPFRGNDEQGQSFLELNKLTLQSIVHQHNIALSDDMLNQMLQLAVQLANQDIENFADIDTARFLDNTWMLIFESNETLSSIESFAYSIVGYREGLMKTEAFLQFLNPRNIFHQFRQTPDSFEFEQLSCQASENVALAREYMGVKLLLAAILEALALTTGGDVPLSMFAGIIRTDDDIAVERAEDYLTPLEESQKMPCDEKIWRLLEFGRTKDTQFDMKRSPLSAYIYQALGAEKTREAILQAKKLFNHQISHEEFLRGTDRFIVSEIAQAVAHLATTRRKALEKWA
jgi:hypothetical protein